MQFYTATQLRWGTVITVELDWPSLLDGLLSWRCNFYPVRVTVLNELSQLGAAMFVEKLQAVWL